MHNPEVPQVSFIMKHYYTDDILKKHIKAYAVKTFNTENLEFLEDFEKFKKIFPTLPSEDEKMNAYKELYMKYLAGDHVALKPLNIGSTLREQIPKTLTAEDLTNASLENPNEHPASAFGKIGEVKSVIESLCKTNLINEIFREGATNFKEEWNDREKKFKVMVDDCKTLKDFKALTKDPIYQALNKSYGTTGVPTTMGTGVQESLNKVKEMEAQFQKVQSDYERVTDILHHAILDAGKPKSIKGALLHAFGSETEFERHLIGWRDAFDSIKLENANIGESFEKIWQNFYKEASTNTKYKDIQTKLYLNISQTELDAMIAERGVSKTMTTTTPTPTELSKPKPGKGN